MPAKRKTARRRRAGRTPARKAAKALARTWDETREVLGGAQHTVQRRVRALVREGGARREQAAEMFTTWRRRFDRERRKAMKQLEQRLATLQLRARRERKAIARVVEDRVQGTLAALNIPSRQEVHDLTRRVEQLSHQIDGFRRARAPRRTAARAHAPASA
jgi:flavin-dependent dehydrogenase